MPHSIGFRRPSADGEAAAVTGLQRPCPIFGAARGLVPVTTRNLIGVTGAALTCWFDRRAA